MTDVKSSNEQLEAAWSDFCRDTPVALRGPWEAFKYAYKSRMPSDETDGWHGVEKLVEQRNAAYREIENLRAALVYSCHAQHATPLHMLPHGITLYNDDGVKVERAGYRVYVGERSAAATRPVHMIYRPVLRYHGAKFRLAGWIMQLFPPHRRYIEPFGGAAGVLLQKPRSYAEVYNDLDGDVVNFFRVLRDREMSERLVQACIQTPYAREEFELAWEPTEEPVERARRLAVRAQMGFGSAGATKGQTGFRIDTNRAWSTAQHLWALYPDAIARVGERLAGVLIENRPALDVMAQHDAPDTLHFCDPPYLHDVRVLQAGKAGYYRHEMTDEQHLELLRFLQGLHGMVIVTGYDSPLYDETLKGWTRRETVARISAGRGAGLRTEVAWLNPACSSVQSQHVMFG